MDVAWRLHVCWKEQGGASSFTFLKGGKEDSYRAPARMKGRETGEGITCPSRWGKKGSGSPEKRLEQGALQTWLTAVMTLVRHLLKAQKLW